MKISPSTLLGGQDERYNQSHLRIGRGEALDAAFIESTPRVFVAVDGNTQDKLLRTNDSSEPISVKIPGPRQRLLLHTLFTFCSIT